MSIDYEDVYRRITKRYGTPDPQALIAVLTPLLIPLHTLDKNIIRIPGQSHHRASFTIRITPASEEVIQRGRTGKFVPKAYAEGAPEKGWLEVAKGRIIEVDMNKNLASGEVYTGGRKTDLEKALGQLSEHDYLEIDQYGAGAKILSSLVECSLSTFVKKAGYKVRRMPEDVARHLGAYYDYDFEFEKDGVKKRIEVKSLWGTNTKYARLIHSLSGRYPTSSCKFVSQDIFAVSLFLRTGKIHDFAFGRSVPEDVQSYGLPRSSAHADHVHQNPTCEMGDGKWFATLDEVWHLP